MNLHPTHPSPRAGRRGPAPTPRWALTPALGLALATLAACGGGNEAAPVVVEAIAVPAAVATSNAAATDFMWRLSTTAAATADGAEPRPITALASSDTEEPVPLP
jgi:hypothetical protein